MKEKRWLLILALILPIAVLVIFLRDFTRETIVIPLLYTLWFLRVVLRLIPQPILWAAVLAISMVIAARTLFRGQRLFRRNHSTDKTNPGRVEFWARRIELADYGEYSRNRLAQSLTDLTVDVLAFQNRQSVNQVRRDLEDEQLSIPPDMRVYLRTGLSPSLVEPVTLLSSIKRRLQPQAPIAESLHGLAQVIEFLEDQLEIHNDH